MSFTRLPGNIKNKVTVGGFFIRTFCDKEGMGMKLKEIIDRFGNLSVYQKRSADDNYCELVFETKDTDKWEGILTDILGSAIKPPKTNLTGEDRFFADKHGGVQSDQTFFRKEIDGSCFIAMLWPWQDREHTTLKIAIHEPARDLKRR